MALVRGAAAAVALLVLSAGCTRSQVTQTLNGPAQPPVVTLSAAGAQPLQLHLFTHEGITFVNQDTRSHEVRFDAARSTDPGCSAIAVGPLDPGQQRTSALLPGFALCYYGVAEAPGDARWQGVVVTH